MMASVFLDKTLNRNYTLKGTLLIRKMNLSGVLKRS